MVTRNAKGWRASTVLGALGTVVMLGWVSGAVAQPSSDYPAGYVVLPKIVVHTTGGTPPVVAGGTATDTIVQITNTDPANPIQVDCFWVDANSHCGGCPSGAASCGPICSTIADCPAGLQCQPGWSVSDFGQVTLTPGQPIGFVASTGLPSLPCDVGFPGPGCSGHCSASTSVTCSVDADCASQSPSGQTCTAEASGSVPGVPEDPFIGELKCVEVDTNDAPVDNNDLKTEATIVTTTIPTAAVPATTAASYNGIGFQAVAPPAAMQDPANPICLGDGLPPGSPSSGCNETYVPCASVLILDNFFEGAAPEFGGIVNTDLTLVPCSEDLHDPTASATHNIAVQFLIYNEFEQRLSATANVECYRSTSLADIDTSPGPSGDNFSVFAQGVEGTLTGQTLIRGVRGADGALGYGITGVAEENFRTTVGGPILSTDAFNIHESSGFSVAGDAVYLDVP